MKGSLEVIVGPMFSGKSEELIRRLRRAEIAKQKVIVYKPEIDNRYSKNNITSHSGIEIEAIPLRYAFEILFNEAHEFDVIGIDETQFFDSTIIFVINCLINAGKKIIISGLDQDFREEPFGFVPHLLALADKVDKLSAICIKCGADATTTQRILNGKPAPYKGKTVIVGASEKYEARCRNCHEKG